MPNFPIKKNPEFKETMEMMDAKTRASFEVFNPIWQQLLDNDNALRHQQNTKQMTLYGSGWGEGPPYEQSIEIASVTADTVLDIAPVIPSGTTAEQEKAIRKAAGYISNFYTYNGGVTAVCIAKRPITDVPIMIRGCG